MSARDPATRKLILEDLGLSAKEAAAGGDPMDELAGMYKIDKIVEKLREIQSIIQWNRGRGEEPTVDNFLFLANPGYVCFPCLTNTADRPAVCKSDLLTLCCAGRVRRWWQG